MLAFYKERVKGSVALTVHALIALLYTRAKMNYEWMNPLI
jgi:hypothetical protein